MRHYTLRVRGRQTLALSAQAGAFVLAGQNATLSEGGSGVATAMTLTGPSAGTTGVASSIFTVGLNGSAPGGLTITMDDAGDGGTFTPTTLSGAGTFTYTAATDGAKSIGITDNQGLTDPADVTFTTVAYAGTDAFRRDGQTYLFQPVPAPLPSTLGGGAYDFEGENSSLWGPTRTHVSGSNYSNWLWDNAGGDWLDSTETRMGTTPWSTRVVSAVGGTPVTYDFNVGTALQFIEENDRWNAWIVGRNVGTSYKYIGGLTNSNSSYRPSIDVTYTDASTATLACRVASRLNSSTPNQLQTEIILSTSAGTGEIALEFERPTKAVSAATLYLTITQDSGAGGTLWANVADPPRNTEPVTGLDGLASSYGQFDEGLTDDANIIGVQRYIDGVVLSDFFAPDNAFNYNQETSYDPAIYGTGSEDLAKLPHAYAGKWIDSNQDAKQVSIVDSSYSSDGFEPLAPGLGAIRVVMPDTGVTTGDEQGNGGNTAMARKLMMPPDEYGLLDRIFVRYYQRLNTTHAPEIADIKEVLRFGNPEWTSMGGKWGIAPEHVTSYGGFSGSSGGQKGWQLRHKWVDGPTDLSTSPPDGNALHSGWHLYDFNTNNPVGYRYQAEPVYLESWGQKGGYGQAFYPGRWYCIEQEVKLNSVDTSSGTGDGLDWTPDGELRVWIDGRLSYERTGMVFRALPLYDPGYSAGAVRPIREIGVKALLWNFYHGGLTDSTHERVQFVTGLAWGKQRIGPMKGVVDYTVPTGAITTLGTNLLASVDPKLDPLANTNYPANPTWHGGTGWPGVTNFSCFVYAKDKGDAGTLMIYGSSGHSAVNATCWAGFDVATQTWSIVGPKPLPVTAVTYSAGVAPDPAFFDHTWGEWLGSAAWPSGFAQPGYNPCIGGHTKEQICFRPASKAGNSSGEIYTTYKQTSSADSGTGIRGCHVIDCDTMLPAHMGALKDVSGGSGDNLGPTLYYEAEDILIGMFAESTSAGSGTYFDVYDCVAQTWTRRTGVTNPPRVGANWQLQSTGFLCGGLYCIVMPTWTANTAPGFKLWGISIADVIGGGAAAWTELTVSASAWPFKTNGLCTMQSWELCPTNGAYYTVDGKSGSSTLYKMAPPSGDDAAKLAGTWTITTETLTGDTLYYSEFLYGRLRWCPPLGAFLHHADTSSGSANPNAPIQAIRPTGV